MNEAHTDPQQLYTEKRTSASTKVTSNGVFNAMLGYFDDEGFSNVASTGYAPITGGQGLRSALEVETSEGVKHMVLDIQDAAANYETLRACKTAFIQIYNMTDQNQAVSNDGGKALFDEQQDALNKNNKKQKMGLGLQ